MKKLLFASVFAILAIGCGCTSEKVIVIDGKVQTNSVEKAASGFSDETYVWEDWIFSEKPVK